MRTFLGGVVVLALALTSASAAAQGHAEVEALIKRGTARLKAGDDLGAYEDLTRAHAIKKDWRSGANGGHVACKLGRFPESVRLLQDGIEMLPVNYEDYDTMKQKFEKRKAECAVNAAALRFVIEPVGAEVLVDGEVIGRAPLKALTYVESGKRQVEVRLAGHQPETITLTAAKGKETVFTIRLSTLAEAPPAAQPTSATGAGMDGVVLGGGIAMLGVGVAGIGTAIALGVMARDSSSAADALEQQARDAAPLGDACAVNSSLHGGDTCVALKDERDAALSLRAGAIGAGVAGGVLLAAGVTTLVLGSQGDGPELAVVVTPRQVSVAVAGAF